MVQRLGGEAYNAMVIEVGLGVMPLCECAMRGPRQHFARFNSGVGRHSCAARNKSSALPNLAPAGFWQLVGVCCSQSEHDMAAECPCSMCVHMPPQASLQKFVLSDNQLGCLAGACAAITISRLSTLPTRSR